MRQLHSVRRGVELGDYADDGKPLGFSYWGCYLFCSVAGTLLFRFIFRSAFLYIEDSGRAQIQKRTIIIGAGQATKMLLKEIDTNPEHCPYHPVALLDDDFKKQHSYLYDVPVKGKISDLPQICEKERAEVIMLAIPLAAGGAAYGDFKFMYPYLL